MRSMLLLSAILAAACTPENEAACEEAIGRINEVFELCTAGSVPLDEKSSCPKGLDDTACDMSEYYECIGNAYSCEDGDLVVDTGDCPAPCDSGTVSPSYAGCELPTDRTVDHSSESVSPKVPDKPETEITHRGAMPIQRPASTAPARTYCANGGTDLPTGDMLEVFQRVASPVPESDPTYLYTYGFVLDQDRSLANNYRASSAFPNDFFDNTDLWFELNYTPDTDWELTASDATSGTRNPVASNACVVVNDDTLILSIPYTELAHRHPFYRVTAFAHTGDYGLDAPFAWSGDVEPPVNAGYLGEWPN